LQESVLRDLFQGLQGTHLQTPPAHSAKKLSGVAAYRLARRGEKVELAPVPVAIHQLEVRSIAGTEAQFYARVSSGTYIRSLAHELGERLGTGAHLAALRRIAVGEFTLASAVPLDQLGPRWQKGDVPFIASKDLLPELPSVLLSEAELQGVRHGRDLTLEAEAAMVRLLDRTGRLCAVGQRVAEGLYHPAVVLSEDSPASPGRASPQDATPPNAQSP
jgi:tRNA pseudouridine55 synthase